MALLAVEGRICVYIGVQVSCENVLDLTRTLDVLWGAIWQLDPIVEEVVSHPKDCLVDTLSTGLHSRITRVLLSLRQSTNGNPVVLRCAKDFTSKTKSFGSTHCSQSLFKMKS